MNAAFTALVLRNCLGRGRLLRLGVKQRPWLEIIRCETELRYLDAQLRALRRLHDGPLEARIDVLSGSGRYDKARLRAGSAQLERAFELLHPQGEREISQQVLEITGPAGVAALWLDQGRWLGRALELRLDWSEAEMQRLIAQIEELGCRSHLAKSRQGQLCGVHVLGRHVQGLAQTLRPHVHRLMRHRLWPGDHR